MSEPLPVNELFDTIQGEGHWTGTPATFLRLQGCDVGCPWCDTKHTWELGAPLHVPYSEILAKKGDGAQYARVDPSTIVESIRQRSPRHVVVTGGEPAQYDLVELTTALHQIGKTTQIETSGTYPIQVNRDTWVTVSPKIDMPGGRVVMPDAIWMAQELKLPVGKMQDVEQLDRLLAHLPIPPLGSCRFPFEIWLQPLSTSEKATALCVQVATERGWKVSLQTHKYAGLR